MEYRLLLVTRKVEILLLFVSERLPFISPTINKILIFWSSLSAAPIVCVDTLLSWGDIPTEVQISKKNIRQHQLIGSPPLRCFKIDLTSPLHFFSLDDVTFTFEISFFVHYLQLYCLSWTP